MQARIPPAFNPGRKVAYPDSTQLLAGEARALWFRLPDELSGTFHFRLYYKSNPYLRNAEAVLMEEVALEVGPERPVSAPLASVRKALSGDENGVDLVEGQLLSDDWSSDPKARLIASEEAELSERLDAIDGAEAKADQIEALLIAMKDRSQQAFVTVRDDGPLGYRAVESPYGGEDLRSEIRWRAVRALVRLDARVALPDMISALHDRHPVVRNEAARALWVFGSGEGLPVLLKGLEGRAFENETANRILIELSGKDAGFDTDAGFAKKQAAIEAWRGILDDLSPTRALPALGEDEVLDRRMRYSIALLGQFQFLFMEQSRRALSALSDFSVAHLEVELPKDAAQSNQLLRAYAVQVLKNVASPRARALLIRLLEEDKAAGVRARAAEALGRLGDESAVAALRSTIAAKDNDEGLRVEATLALARMPELDDLSLLEKGLAQGSQRRRRAAAYALLRHGQTGAARELLLSQLASSEIDERSETIELLEEWSGETLGYTPQLEGSERAAAISRWRQRLAD